MQTWLLPSQVEHPHCCPQALLHRLSVKLNLPVSFPAEHRLSIADVEAMVAPAVQAI
jgi:hypothetical protein